MIAGNRDWIKLRRLPTTPRNYIRNQAQAGSWREYIGPARYILLEDVVLECSLNTGDRDALAFRHDGIHRQQNGRRCVDRHRSRHAVQGDAREELLHVSEGVDGHPYTAHL